MAENDIVVSLRDVGRTFMDNGQVRTVLENISLDIRKNEFLVILGSGKSGKSLLLDMIAGLDADYFGDIEFAGGERPDLGIVFQQYALFPWKTVMGNVEAGLKFKGVEKSRRRDMAQRCIDMVGLTGFESHYPVQLSGGMKQRTAIARAYAGEAPILLMDEPFGALDAQTRYQMEAEILRIWETDKRTIVFVTNNIEEAVYLGDRVVLLGGEPSTIKRETRIDMPRKRCYTDPQFLRVRNAIAQDFELVL